MAKVSIDEFAQKVKEKYPEYKDVDNKTLTLKIIEKYPEYKDSVELKPSPSLIGQALTKVTEKIFPPITATAKEPLSMLKQILTPMLPKPKEAVETYGIAHEKTKIPILEKAKEKIIKGFEQIPEAVIPGGIATKKAFPYAAEAIIPTSAADIGLQAILGIGSIKPKAKIPKIDVIKETKILKAIQDGDISPDIGRELLKKHSPDVGSIPGLPEDMVYLTKEGSNPAMTVRQAVASVDATTKQIIKEIPNLSPEAIEKVITLKDGGKRVSEVFYNMIENKHISPEDGAKVLGLELKTGEGRFAFLQRIKEATTSGGQLLNRWSQVQKALETQLGKNSPIMREMNKILTQNAKEIGILRRMWNPVGEVGRGVIDTWRALLVTATKTAVRNFISQGLRWNLETINDVMNGSIRAITGMEPFGKAMSQSINDVTSIARFFKKGEINKTLSVLEKYPKLKLMFKSRLFDEASSKNKILQYLNYLNYTQEGFYRSIAFDNRLRSNLTRLGYKIEDLPTLMKSKRNAKAIEMLVNDATEFSLERTFAAYPRLESAKWLLKGFQKMPFLHVLTEPYPRFMMQATKFITEYSPAGIMFSPRRFASKNPEEIVNAFTMPLLGIMMLGGALAIRGSKYAGEKYYEIRTSPDTDPNKVLNAKAFAPVMIPHLFVADMILRVNDIKHGKRYDLGYSNQDVADALYSMRRSDLSGMPLLDNLVFGRSDVLNTPEKFMKYMDEQTNNFVGGFSTPVRNVRDFIQGAKGEPMEYKDARQVAIYGQFLDAFPYLRESLPTSYSPTRPEARKQEHPMAMFWGFNIQKRTDFEKKLAELSINNYDWNKSTGIRYMDNLLNQQLGTNIPTYMEKLWVIVDKIPAIDDKKEFTLKYLRKFRRIELIKLSANPEIKALLEKKPTKTEKTMRMWGARPQSSIATEEFKKTLETENE